MKPGLRVYVNKREMILREEKGTKKKDREKNGEVNLAKVHSKHV